MVSGVGCDGHIPNPSPRAIQLLQEEAEPVDAFITALYNLASKCDYGTLNDELIRDRIVVGIRNQSLSEKMQLDETLTLEKAARMARESKAVKKQQP